MTGFRTLQDWEQSVASDPRSQEQALEAAREQDQRKQRADVTDNRAMWCAEIYKTMEILGAPTPVLQPVCNLHVFADSLQAKLATAREAIAIIVKCLDAADYIRTHQTIHDDAICGRVCEATRMIWKRYDTVRSMVPYDKIKAAIDGAGGGK